jgi:hypothetical protein
MTVVIRWIGCGGISGSWFSPISAALPFGNLCSHIFLQWFLHAPTSERTLLPVLPSGTSRNFAFGRWEVDIVFFWLCRAERLWRDEHPKHAFGSHTVFFPVSIVVG